MFTSNDIAEIILNCKTEGQLHKVAELVGNFKGEYSFEDLLLIAGFLELRRIHLDKNKFIV